MVLQKYEPENCPCPSDCTRRRDCKACIQFHHGRDELTYCEYLFERGAAAPPSDVDETAIQTGREIRLMNYGLCAG